MFKFVFAICLVAGAAIAGDIQSEYLPPHQEIHYQQPVEAIVEYEVAPAPQPIITYESGPTIEVIEPGHVFTSDEGYRYKTNKRRVLKNRRVRVFKQKRRA